MPWTKAEPVIDPGVRDLCRRSYPGHPKGCPNYGKRKTCPPQAPLIHDLMMAPFYLIWNVFDFKGHVERMRKKHPDWSERQLACCLYWQPSARKSLRAEIAGFLEQAGPDWIVLDCPEACGLNVHASMEFNAGVILEWPPQTVACQVALAGEPVPL